MQQTYTAEEIMRAMRTLYNDMGFDDFAAKVLQVTPCKDNHWQREKWLIVSRMLSSIVRIPHEVLECLLDLGEELNEN